MIKKLFLILTFLAALGTYTFAQDTLKIFDDMKENVVVYQDSAITRLMLDKIAGIERHETTIQGFRVQLFSSNDIATAKNAAFNLEKRVSEKNLSDKTYVQYNSPFWKVRVGDYKTNEEAQLMRAELIKLFPDLQGDIYVVRDQITILE